MRKLENKIAVITGASSGIGKAIAIAFAREGATSVVLDLSHSGVAEVVDFIVGEGNNAWGQVCDVGSAQAVRNAMMHIQTEVGDVDIMVNNAGILDDFMPAADLDMQQWHHVMNVDLNGTF